MSVTAHPGDGSMGRTFVVAGARAAGKSTVARALADALVKSVCIDGSVLESMVAAGRMPLTSEPTVGALEQLFTRWAGALTLADVWCANGFDAVIADDIIGDYLEDFLDLADTGPVHLVVLHPSIDALYERQPAKAAFSAEYASVENLWNEVEFNTPRVGLWIDNSAMTPAAVVVRVLRNLQDATVAPGALSSGTDDLEFR